MAFVPAPMAGSPHQDRSPAAAHALHRTFGWTIDSDFGTFASLALPQGIPLWINAPADGESITGNLVVLLSADDVDTAFAESVSRGAVAVREPQDMDFGERSACVRVEGAPGLLFDVSQPLA